ncbi:tumor necrosis factor ligand superfamily member 14 [Betta splendens]|uniref:Tumor necrosis factor ligand superfamily member 14 n=1 Tax=Betta splendens TaxID=158456 RepID=A0A6P7NCQ7_BETSP|nr:tumor necrosis factor ligand superfamily member 14 [Betta splendens]
MSEGAYPSVYVVDSHAGRPPVPPRLKPRPQRPGAAQTLLVLLVSMALCGMAIEACFIYRLYQSQSDSSPSASKQTADEPTGPETTDVHPSKPVAHLTDGTDVDYGPGRNQQIMTWSTIADPILYEMRYEDGKLLIQKEGFYYVYSEVNFQYDQRFHHTVLLATPLYRGEDIPLLQSRRFSEGHGALRSNSFLGGVFHLHKGDGVYVKVYNVSQIVRHRSYENTFGMYMI